MPRQRHSRRQPRTLAFQNSGLSEWAGLIAVAILLVFAVGFGGGGVRYAMANLVVQLTALCVLAFSQKSVFDFWSAAPWTLKTLAALTLLLPVAQLIPLPESIWSALPGRDLVQQSFALTGRTGWAPMSVDPVRTMVALTGLIAPCAILFAGWSIPYRQLPRLGWILVGVGLITFMIGALQVLSNGQQALIFADGSSANVLRGTFANRNSTGLLLVGTLALAAVLPVSRRHPAALPTRIVICILLLIGVLLTRSRTALVLAAIPVGLAALRAYFWSRQSQAHEGVRFSKVTWGVLGAIMLALAAVAIALVAAPGRVNDTIERFQTSSDARTYIWEDSAYSVSRYWPAGAGMGTFDEVFQVDESLENTTERRAGRAHNDWLEVMIEAGAPGLALAVLWLGLVAWLAWRARLSRLRWMAWANACFLLAIGLQSITDYPLRNQAMLVAASLALLLLARVASEKREDTA